MKKLVFDVFEKTIFIVLLSAAGCGTIHFNGIPSEPDGIKVTKDIIKTFKDEGVSENDVAKLFIDRKNGTFNETKLKSVDGNKFEYPYELYRDIYGLFGIAPGIHELEIEYYVSATSSLYSNEYNKILTKKRFGFIAGHRYILLPKITVNKSVLGSVPWIKVFELIDITNIDDLIDLIEKNNARKTTISTDVLLSLLYSIAPHNSEYYYYGKTSQEIGKTSQEKYSKQIDDLDKIVKKRPDLSVPYYLRGLAYLYVDLDNKIQIATNNFLKAIKTNPDFGSAYTELGKVYETTDKEKAILNFKKAVDLGEEIGSFYLKEDYGIIYPERK